MDVMVLQESVDVGLIFSFFLVLATFVLGWATWVLGKETKLLREYHEMPRISIELVSEKRNRKLLNLKVINAGQGVAMNVKFGDIKGPVMPYPTGTQTYYDARHAGELALFRQGVKRWEPGHSFVILVGVSVDESYKTASDAPWIFPVEYESVSGKKFIDELYVDASLLNVPYWRESDE